MTSLLTLMLTACSILSDGGSVPPAEAATPEIAKVHTKTITSKRYHIDQKYASMRGPYGFDGVTLLDTDSPELLWITGYRTVVVDAKSEKPLSQEWMCHANLDFDATEYYDRFPTAPPISGRLFTVLEGWRIRDIDAALVAKGWIEPGAYTAVAEGKTVSAPFDVPSPTYEGYLYPETYAVPAAGFTPELLVTRQLATFQERFLEPHGQDLKGRTLHEIVVMASMLEREEPKPENRALVAGILWNRIDHDDALGVDATSRYELDEWNDRKAFIKKLKDKSDRYNSRYNKGLPPTAIGNPTVSSLKAAIDPEETDFWYYLHDHEKNLHPSLNAAEHEAKRKKYNVY